jgi:outer membrane protein TolC
VGDTGDPLWSATLSPVDRPGFSPTELDVPAAIRHALEDRTDIDILRKTVQTNDTTLRYLTNQLLPQADLVASYGLAGLGGTELVRTGSGIVGSGSSGSSIASAIPGGYGDALASLTNYPRWSVGLTMNYPLGLSAQKVAVSRARVQQNQVDAQIKQAELQVATDVTSAAISVRASLERVQAAQAARVYAKQALEAEQTKFRVGLSTNYLIIQQQNALATAQNNELQAQLNYRISLEEWDRLQHTTLSSTGITIISAVTSSVR